ncbi:MAG TPA: phenylalanine--tRNA ligase subunit alpha [Firmicutes bacterium]|nr:phenylalanine--tRNA ligase subunit alpha [Bacillota bacterium]
MRERVQQIISQALQELDATRTLNDLEAIRVKYLGRKGLITLLLRGLGELPPERRPEAGRLINDARASFEAKLQSRGEELAAVERERVLAREVIDITMPGRRPVIGSMHPVTIIYNELERIFSRLGFEVVTGPEIELDYYNFEALNVPKYHPARDIQDTFYVSEDVVLRTHTSPMQVRTMERRKPPIRIVVPGRVYRSDASDASHSPMFHQLEGLAVDEDVTFADLKGTLEIFARDLFGPETEVRFRPSYFPFTEPSAEVDISCIICGGKGCRVCKNTGWLEILGSGMVHPNVLRNVGYDPGKVSGFAFGMGVDRIAMLRFGIDDMRLLFENDMRFLKQF